MRNNMLRRHTKIVLEWDDPIQNQRVKKAIETQMQRETKEGTLT